MTYVIDLLAAIPSVVYGFWALAVLTHPATDVLPAHRRHDRQGAGAQPALRRPGERRELHDRRAHPRGDDHADHHVAQPRGAARPSRRTTRTPRSRWARPAGRCCASRCSRACAAVSSARSMLGLGRAMGETIAVALVIGAQPPDHVAPLPPGRLDGVGHRAQLRRGRPALHRAALIGLGVVLFAITIVVNVARPRRSRAAPIARSGGRAMTVVDTARAARDDDPATGSCERAVSPRRRVVERRSRPRG